MRAYFCILEVAVSVNRCTVIQGCRICNKMEEDGNSSYPPTPLNASIIVYSVQYSDMVHVAGPPSIPPKLASRPFSKAQSFADRNSRPVVNRTPKCTA